MLTRFPLPSGRRGPWLALVTAVLLLTASSFAARPERLAVDRQAPRKPSYLTRLGLAPAEAPRPPAAKPSAAARADLERLQGSGSGRWRADWDTTKGTPIMVYGGRLGPYQGTPEAAARAFLRDYADLFNLAPDAAPKKERSIFSAAGTHVQFVQRLRGLTVHNGVITVLVDGEGFVRMASGGFHRLPGPRPVMGVAADQALKNVLRRVVPGAELTRAVSPNLPAQGVPADKMLEYGGSDALPQGMLHRAQMRAVWFPTDAGLRITWATDVALGDHMHEFRVFVDGESGEPVYAEMLSKTTHESIRVYTTNPQSSDLSDEDIPDVDKPVAGGDLSGAFTFVFNDQATEIADGNYLHSTNPDDPTVDLNFDEQNVFYHNNLIRQFFVDLNGGPDLGGAINLDTNPMSSWVHLRALQCNGGDNAGLGCTSNPDCPGGSCDINLNVENAFFSPSTDQTLFGHGSFHTGALFGSRDFALEESVVYHEYSHRVNDNIAGFGGVVYGSAMNEGVADYWAASYVDEKYIGEFLNPDPEVGDDSGWLGFQGFIRSMDNDRTLADLCDNIFDDDGCEEHSDGEIYGGILWDLRQALIAAVGPNGVSVADRMVLQHVFNLSPVGDADDFIEGRSALLTASNTLFGGVYECLIWQVFANRGMGIGADLGNPPTTAATANFALPAECVGTATVEFSEQFYTCAGPDSASLTVTDAGGGGVLNIDVNTSSGDSETFPLSWTAGVGTTPAFDVVVGPFTKDNGIIEVAAENERILAIYNDDDPAQFSFAASSVDCTPDLRFESSLVFNGSCDGDDPFLDAGEAGLLEVNLSLEMGIDLSTNPLDLTLTLVSNNGDVTVSAPSTIVPVASVNGTRIDVTGVWAVEADAGVSAAETVVFDVLVGGVGITGSQSAISFTEVLEQDLSYTPQSVSYNFISGEQGFFASQNGETGTETWFRQTHNCAGAPDSGYWHQGANNCGSYGADDSSWLVSPWVQIQPPSPQYPSRLVSLRYQHRVDFAAGVGAAPFIESDRTDLIQNDPPDPINLGQLNAFYDETNNTPDFVQEDIDLSTGLPSGFQGSHGIYRFRWLFIGGGGVVGGRDGWFVDNVEINWEVPTVVADVNAPASCTAAAVLEFDSNVVLDGTGGGAGNSDEVVDPGETIGLPVTLDNSGNQSGVNIVGHLSSDRPDIITITDGTATFPSILPLETETSNGPHFEFAVSASAECLTVVNFTVVLDHNGAAGASTVTFPVRIGSLAPAASAFFADNFETDTGAWTVNPSGTDDATTGAWERIDPTAYWYFDDPANNNLTQPNIDFDPGSPVGLVYITQNGVGAETFSDHDVDNGVTTLQSNTYNLTTLVEPTVSYARWVYNRDGTALDEFLFEISNNDGGSWTTVESVSDENGIPLNPVTNVWIPKTWVISEHLAVTNQMKFRFIAQDQSGQIIEAAVDGFEIRASEGVCNPALLIPDEVSPPGAATPLTLTSPAPGQVTLTWETTPIADTYRVVSGDLADLVTFGGVTASSAAPLECGIAGTSASYTPAGSVFFVVQGEGPGGVGTAGSGTTVPRNPSLVCP